MAKKVPERGFELSFIEMHCFLLFLYSVMENHD